VPSQNNRFVPDVSLFASSGYPDGVTGSAYLICVASESPEKSCTKDYANPDDIVYQEVGGTSVSSPAMAGIMALVVQKVGSNQGLANPVLYKLAGKESWSACDSFTVANGNSCVFYDISMDTNNDIWTNAQPCSSGTPDCVVNTTGDTIGIVSSSNSAWGGYNSTVGYDMTTGLGSVNAANLVAAWPASTTTTPTATLTPSPLTFPNTVVGSASAAKSVTLKNTSTSTLNISTGGVTISGSGYKSFVPTATTCDLNSDGSGTLDAGSSCTFTLEFAPTTTGTITATLAVADNATGSPQQATLTGTGEPKSTSGSSITLTPSSLAFPNTTKGTTSEAQPVTVKNTSTSAVTLNSITISPASFIELNACPASLGAGKSCTIFVAFKPASAALLKGTLSVADTASSSKQTVPLSGTGTAADSVTLSTKSLTFAAAEGVTSEAQSVTVTNKGSSTLDITGIAVTGFESANFTQLNTCGPTLAPAASCAIDVAFKPAGTGTFTASLVITDNGSTATQTVSLKGTEN